MQLICYLKKIARRHLSQLSWQGVGLIMVVYTASSWLLLWLSGEKSLTTSVDFFYWLVVTSSTVGYGDLSPVTPAGKLIVSFYIIPVGLTMFAMVVGRIAIFSSYQWKKGIRGLKMINVSDHILVLGWNAQRSVNLLKLLVQGAETNRHRAVVLCVTDPIENPLPDSIQFVRVSSYTDDADLDRACIAAASCIVIDSELDDITLSTALYAYSRNASANILVYFKNDALSEILKKHCPNVESMPSIAAEMLAKSAMDPGSSVLHQELLNPAYGMMQYAVCYTEGEASLSVAVVFDWLKKTADATLIGMRHKDQTSLILNPPLQAYILPGDTLHYIAASRLDDAFLQQGMLSLANKK